MGYAGTPPPYAEVRPGIVPLRPLGLDDIFTGATLAIRGNPAATFGLGLVTTLILVAPATALGAYLVSVLVGWTTSGDPASTDLLDGLGEVGSVLPSFAAQLAGLLMTAFTAHVIAQGVLGRKVTLQQTWDAARGRLWQVVGSAALVFLMILATVLVLLGVPVLVLVRGIASHGSGTTAAGLLLTLIGALVTICLALFLGTRYAFAPSAIVLEQLGVRAGLGRSWRLTSGSAFWRVLGIRLLVAVLVAVVGSVLSVPIGLLLGRALDATGVSAATLAVLSVAVRAVATIVIGTLTTPFSAGTDTLLYLDQRIRREALDVRLAAAVGGP